MQRSTLVQVTEIIVVFLVAFLVIGVGWRLVGDSLLARQAVVWVANVLMLVSIWIGLRLRGQTWEHFGLSWHFAGWRTLLRSVLQSIVLVIVALIAFVAGAVLMMNLVAAPQGADVSGYGYLQGNLPMLLLALAAVYVVSSFGEEVVYRGFLMSRVAELGGGSRAAWSIAVAISAVVFGLAHFSWGVVGIVQTAFMGLALAIAYLVVRRNLWVLILAHAYVDTLLLLQMYLGRPAVEAG